MPRRGADKPQPFFRPRELSRLIGLFVLAAIVCLSIVRARNPDTWRSWTGRGPAAPQPEPAEADPFQLAERPAPPAPHAASPASGTAPAASTTKRSAEPLGDDALPLLLARIKDRTPPMKSDTGAFFYLLHKAATTPPAVLARQALRNVLLVNLWNEPAKYRGKPIHLHGRVRRLVSYDAGENLYDVKTLYEAWIFTAESQDNPYCVIFTRLPAGMPLTTQDEDVDEEVAVDGYFLKDLRYRARGGVARGAPELLAYEPQWIRRPAVATTDWRWPVAGGLLVTLVVIITVAVWYTRREQRYAQALHRSLQPTPRDDQLLDVQAPLDDLPPPLFSADAPDDPDRPAQG